MKQLRKRAVALAVIALLFSCNAAKKIAQQDTDIDALKAKWIGDYVLSHPCPTIAAFNLDSLCALYYSPVIKAESNDSSYFISADAYDTLKPRDSIIIDGGGTMTALSFTVDPKGRMQIISKDTVHIAVPYEDTRKVNLLLDSVNAKDVRIATLSGSIAASAKDCNTAIKAADKKGTKWMWLFIAACVLIAVRLGISIYTFIHGGVLGKIKL